MTAWIVALVTGGLTLIVALLTTFLNGRTASRNLRSQLAVEIDRDRARREHENAENRRVRLFEHQRAAAVGFLEAFETYSLSSAHMLGATFALSNGGAAITWKDKQSIEEEWGTAAALRSLSSAMSSVEILLPEDVAQLASSAYRREVVWSRAVVEHYEQGRTDPGPHPAEIYQSLNAFRKAASKLLGVEDRT